MEIRLHHPNNHDGADAQRHLSLRDGSRRAEHRDLAAIAPDGVVDGVEVINRTKSGISPFAPIVKTPNYAENSGNLTGYSVEIRDDSADTGYRHMGNVSEKYLLLPNSEVRALGLEIAEASGLPYRESRVFFDGGRFAHIVDFGEEVAHDVSVDGTPDPVGLSLVMRSSYDQSWRFEAALMGKRFLCDNGLFSGEFFQRVSFKHTTGDADEDWREVVRQGARPRPPRPARPRPVHALAAHAPPGADVGQAAPRGVGALPADGGLHRGEGDAAVRRARGGDDVRVAAGRHERVLAQPEVDGGGLGAQRGVRDGALRVRQRAAELAP